MGGGAEPVVRKLRLVVQLAVALLASNAAMARAEAHPLHSTITELVSDQTRGTVRATVRIFADDLRTAALRSTRGHVLPTEGLAWDAAVLAYVSSAFTLQDAHGRRLPLRSCGVRRTADLVWLCLEADAGRSGGPLRVGNAMLCELYEDQVNVVQGTVGGSRRSLLFVRGDGLKELR